MRNAQEKLQLTQSLEDARQSIANKDLLLDERRDQVLVAKREVERYVGELQEERRTVQGLRTRLEETLVHIYMYVCETFCV